MRGWRPNRYPKRHPPEPIGRERFRGSQRLRADGEANAAPRSAVLTVNPTLTRPRLPEPRSALRDRPDHHRRREPCPADKDALHKSTLETWTQINRIPSHRTTRRGAAATIEATSGFGGRPEKSEDASEEWEQEKEWFTPFIEGYDGTNPAAYIECDGQPTACVLDTGAGCNLIGTETLKELMPHYKETMKPTKTRARDVRDKPVHLAGAVTMTVKLGGSKRIQVELEVVPDTDLLIIGNPLLYEEDLVIVAREGFGTRKALPTSAARKARTFPIYAAEEVPVEQGDLTEVKVTTRAPKRTWVNSINRAFLVTAEADESNWKVHPTISAMHTDGTMIALVDTTRAAQAVTIEKGARIGTATTEFREGEDLVTAVMADLVNVQRELRHVSASQMVEPSDDLDEEDMQIEPPGFELDGPKPGTVKDPNSAGRYDTERENEGGTPETATLHTRDPKQREAVRKLLQNHRNLFSRSNYDIGHFMIDGEVQKVKLTLSDTSPIVEKYRTLSPAKREAAEQILQELERAKIISQKASQFASQAVWVTKAAPEMTAERAKKLNIPFVPGSKDQASPRNLRFCQDYRLLNARLQSVNWPLPNIKGMLSRLKDKKVVTLLDASHSFFCIELDEESKLYTGFQTCERQYVMNRLAMGLKCSTGILNACLARTLAGLENVAFPYSDNIVVASKDEATHTQDLARVFKALENHGWKFKLAKCHIGVTKCLRIFGMELDLEKGRMKPDPSKAKALRETKLPRTRKQLKSFLGGIGYFVECLPDIGDPLATLHEYTKLTNNPKETTIQWKEEGEKAFREVIKILQRHNEVTLPDWRWDFHLITDAGPQHVASMLAQIDDNGHWVPVGFWTKKLSSAEKNLSQIEKEALAIVVGLRQTSYYTSHSKVYIHSDNRPFILLHKFANQSQKIARWKLFIESFDVTLVWEPSDSAGLSFVDFLSRPPEKKLANQRITREQINSIPNNGPTGIFDKHRYEKILEDLVNQGDATQEGEKTLEKALKDRTPLANGKPTTREQWRVRARLATITAKQKFSIGKPQREAREIESAEEATLNIILNESPHLNLNQLKKLQQECSQLGTIYRDINGHPNFMLHQGILLRRQDHEGIRRLQLAIPVCIADDLIGDIHRGATTCHAGKKKLRQMITTRFYVPQLNKRVEKIVQNCGICGYYKARKFGGPRPDARKITADGPGQIWAADHIQITSTPDDKDRTSALCFVDLYSHYVVCRAVPKTITAEQAADVFLEEVVAKFGVCKGLLSDNGPDMDNQLIREMANLLGIRKLTIAPGSPKSNGVVEKVQGLILNSIKLQGAQYKVRPDRFADLLVWAALCHNATPYQDIEPPLSPAEIFLGRSIPEATFFAFNNAQYAYENLTQFNTRMVAAQATIAEIIGAKERYLRDNLIKQRVLQAKHWQFPPGTIVAVRDKTQARKETNVKLRPRYRGAFIVVKETPTACLVRPYSSETILEDMEEDEEATRGRGRKLPKYKIMKCDKGDLKKMKHLLFYSMPLARKFAEQLASPSPNPNRAYWVTEDQEPQDDLVVREPEQEGAPEEEPPETGHTSLAVVTSIQGVQEKRKKPPDEEPPHQVPAKIARITTPAAFPFEEADEDYL